VKTIVAGELMTAVSKTVGAVHSRQRLHSWLGLVTFEPAMGLWMVLLRARYSLVLLPSLKRTLDGERFSVLVNGLCLHCHREQG
jgi:hypothetical protein